MTVVPAALPPAPMWMMPLLGMLGVAVAGVGFRVVFARDKRRTFARRLLDLFAVLSLLVCVGVAALCVQSFHYSRAVYWVRQDRTGCRLISTELMVSRGGLSASVRRWEPRPGRRYDSSERPGVHYDTDHAWRRPLNRLGFGAGRYVDQVSAGTTDWVWVPLWLVAVLLATPAAVRAATWARRRFRRRAPGLCHACSYDLRATPGRCPECGKVQNPTVSALS